MLEVTRNILQPLDTASNVDAFRDRLGAAIIPVNKCAKSLSSSKNERLVIFVNVFFVVVVVAVVLAIVPYQSQDTHRGPVYQPTLIEVDRHDLAARACSGRVAG